MIRAHELNNRAILPDGPAPEAVSPQELASQWGVHVDTVYRDIRKGALRAFRLPGGGLRIRKQDADRYGRPLW